MKKIFVIALSVFAFLVNACTGWAAYYDEGNDGNSWETAYVINSWEDLTLMRDRVNNGSDAKGKYYKLNSDIDITINTYWRSIGLGAYEFTGHFNGQNHTINMNVDVTMYYGLFYSIATSNDEIAVKDLNITGTLKITSNDVSVSPLATRLHSGIIENCTFKGTLEVDNNDLIDDYDTIGTNSLLGGLVNHITGGTIRQCTVNAKINASNVKYTGGIVGGAFGSREKRIEDCTVEDGTEITTSGVAGGIVGFAEHSYSGGSDSVTLAENVCPSQYREVGREAHLATNDGTVSVPTFSNNDDYDLINTGETWENAYVLNNVNDFVLMLVRMDQNGGKNAEDGYYFRLSADIELNTDELSYHQVIRSDDNAISERGGYIGDNLVFRAHFDGQNHTITISGSKPLFAAIETEEGTIALRNLNIKSSGTNGIEGASLAKELKSGIIENCNFNGQIISLPTQGPALAGGLFESMSGGTVRNCTINGTIRSSTSNFGGVTASEIDSTAAYAGGIVGKMTGGTVDGCTINSEINATSYSGGIAGYISGGYIRNCKILGTLKSESNNNGYNASAGYNDGVPAANFSGNVTSNEGTTTDNTTTYINQITWNKHRYQIYNETVTWEQAKTRCEELGGHLVTITSTQEQERVQYLLENAQTDYSSYWIGAKTNNSGFWEWVTNEVFEKQYQNFAQGQPDGSGNYLEIAVNGEWYNAGNTSHGFICEFEETQDKIETAPVATDFENWRKNPSAWLQKEEGMPSGALPSPINTLHLSLNPPKDKIEIASIPAKYDLREKITLPDVKVQGNYQTCWAFASIGAMEIDYLTHKMTSLGENPDLSELHVAWFLYNDARFGYTEDVRLSNGGILEQGGDANKAVSFLGKTEIAPINETELPYSEVLKVDTENADNTVKTLLNGKETGSFDKAKIILIDAPKISDIKQEYTNDTDNINKIKKAIIDHGAVYFRYCVDKNGYNSEKEWQFYSTKDNIAAQHAALLVGWDDDYPVENFKEDMRPKNKGAWLVRTSINTNPIGDKYGCFWMSYEQAATNTGIVDLRVFVVSEDNTSSLNQAGNTGENTNITYSWSANIFYSRRNESLIRVAFNTTDNNAHYNIFVNNFGKIQPTDPGKTENCIASGDIPYAGYHTVDLPTPVNLYNGDYYSIILELTPSSGSSYKYPTAAAANIENYANITVNEGENFFAAGSPVPSVWQDGKTVEGGPFNACIQAFTVERITDETAPSITTESLPNAYIGEDYKFQLEASGTETIEWRANIPEGFALSKEGLLTGKAVTAGSYEMKITAFNDVGMTDKTFTLSVSNESLGGSGGGCNIGISVLCCVFAVVYINMKRR
ncbi:MAG: hypothetical protein IJP69_07430 [Synergistaceae bacterium]|nr:hypothetical protein [Synergistaceae bacterium]